MKKYLTEFIGTFFLVLTVVMVANNPAIAGMAPLAMAGTYLAMVYAGGPVSGGHYNPAITIAMLMGRKIHRDDALYYVVAQLIASVLAAAIGVYLHDCSGGLNIVSRVNEQAICSIFAEFLGTFGLVYVLLSITAPRPEQGTAFQGLATGFTLLAMGYALGGLSGGAFNPAVAVGASVAGMFAWGDFYIYLIGNLLGAAAASTVFQFLESREDG